MQSMLKAPGTKRLQLGCDQLLLKLLLSNPTCAATLWEPASLHSIDGVDTVTGDAPLKAGPVRYYSCSPRHRMPPFQSALPCVGGKQWAWQIKLATS